MKKTIREFIEKLRAKAHLSELDELLLKMLLARQEELGENPTEEEEEKALRQVLKEHLMITLQQSPAEAGKAAEETAGELEAEITLLREIFREMRIQYQDFPWQKNVHAFELCIHTHGKRLGIRIYLDVDPRVCRIDVIYPFTADQVFAYPLCEMLAKKNYHHRFGVLHYDPEDGEVSSRCIFPIKHGLHKDDFLMIFLMMVKSAYDDFDQVRQYASGRFRPNARQELLENIQKLREELE